MKQQRIWAVWLFRYAAVFALIGTYIGSQMSGNGDYGLRPIHAHVLLVGWLSVFAWGIFYYVVPVKKQVLVTIHCVLGLIGALGLTAGMWLYNLNPFGWNETLVMIVFIVGGSLLLIAFLLFLVNTFFIDTKRLDRSES